MLSVDAPKVTEKTLTTVIVVGTALPALPAPSTVELEGAAVCNKHINKRVIEWGSEEIYHRYRRWLAVGIGLPTARSAQ